VTLCLALLAAACREDPGRKLVDRSIVHLEAAVDILVQGGGDEQKVLVQAMAWRARHGREMAEIRQEGHRLWNSLGPAERQALERYGRSRSQNLWARMQAEARRYPRPAEVLRYVRPLIIQAVPRPSDAAKPGSLPWLPGPPPALPHPATPDLAPGVGGPMPFPTTP
jgi:chorismate mutase